MGDGPDFVPQSRDYSESLRERAAWQGMARGGRWRGEVGLPSRPLANAFGVALA
jgi:hypothetical protein